MNSETKNFEFFGAFMNIVLESIAFNAARAKDRESERYFDSQSRRLAADSGSAHRVIDPVTGEWVIAQPPIKAIERGSGVSTECGPLVIERTYETPPEPRQTLPRSGAPVDLTLGDIDAMAPGERALALAQVCAVDGARERIRTAGCATLRQALAKELAYQRWLVREGKRAEKQGRERHLSKTTAKRDIRKGHRRMRDGGTARMVPDQRHEAFFVNVVAPMVEGHSWTRKLGRHEQPILSQNFEKD